MMNTMAFGFVVAILLSMTLPQASHAQPTHHLKGYTGAAKNQQARDYQARDYADAVIDGLSQTHDAFQRMNEVCRHLKPHDPRWRGSFEASLAAMRQQSAQGKALKAPPGCAHLQETYGHGLSELDLALALMRDTMERQSDQKRQTVS